MPIPLKKRAVIERIAKIFFLKYAEENGHGTQYDFSKIPIRIHKRNANETYLIVIESPKEECFYAPKNILFLDRAFIEIANEKVTTTNPYAASAPMWYDEQNANIRRVGIYPGAKYFTESLERIKKSILKNNITIDFKRYIDVDLIISNEEIVQLFSKKGIFYEIDENLICIIIFKINPATNRHYRLHVYYKIKAGILQNIVIKDTTPPPCLM